jgi:hypothetical protein
MKEKTIYQKVVEAGIPFDSHESDLYVEVNPASTALVKRYYWKKNVTTFVNQVTKTLWYDIPFSYDPFWENKLKP